MAVAVKNNKTIAIDFITVLVYPDILDLDPEIYLVLIRKSLINKISAT